jgi:hypothetical protein
LNNGKIFESTPDLVRIKFSNKFNLFLVSLILPQVDANVSLPFITGGKLGDNEFELVGLHYHWGDKNNRGSEVRLFFRKLGS